MTQVIDLGEVSAYALAVKYGYQGTEEEWVKSQQKFHDDSQTAAQNAAESARTASVSAYESQESADLSESYAVGTGGRVRENDATDNSKFYSEQSRNSALLSENYYEKTKETGDNAIDSINGAIDNINKNVPKFLINPKDGKLYHTKSRFTFVVNRLTGNLDWGLTI